MLLSSSPVQLALGKQTLKIALKEVGKSLAKMEEVSDKPKTGNFLTNTLDKLTGKSKKEIEGGEDIDDDDDIDGEEDVDEMDEHGEVYEGDDPDFIGSSERAAVENAAIDAAKAERAAKASTKQEAASTIQSWNKEVADTGKRIEDIRKSMPKTMFLPENEDAIKEITKEEGKLSALKGKEENMKKLAAANNIYFESPGALLEMESRLSDTRRYGRLSGRGEEKLEVVRTKLEAMRNGDSNIFDKLTPGQKHTLANEINDEKAVLTFQLEKAKMQEQSLPEDLRRAPKGSKLFYQLQAREKQLPDEISNAKERLAILELEEQQLNARAAR